MLSDSALPPDQALRVFRLLEVLRSYDNSGPAESEQELVSLLSSFPEHGDSSQSTPLHLAVKCGTLSALQLTLHHRQSDLNAQDANGSTPLHLAASIGRPDVVSLLLSQPDIDDAIKDNNYHTCLDVAKGPEEASRLQASRSQLNASYLELLNAYVNTSSSSDSSATSIRSGVSLDTLAKSLERNNLFRFVNQPRGRAIDFSTKAPSSRGTTILHEAARRRDLELLQICISKGADVLVRDGRGKLPSDVARAESVKVLLKQAVVAEGQALKAGSAYNIATNGTLGLPSRSGYLLKWTNLARGYRSRWFVLSNGTLTYYRHQEDEGKVIRGEISMSIARIAGPSEDKLKFEVSVNTGKTPRYYLKASHPVETMRWVEDIKLNIEAARSTSSISNSLSGTAASLSRLSMTSPSTTTLPLPAPSRSYSAGSSSATPLDTPYNEEQPSGGEGGSLAGDDDTLNQDQNPNLIPHAETFDLLASSTKTQVSATEQLLESLIVSSVDDSSSISRPQYTFRQAEVKDALRQSLHRLSCMLEEYQKQVADREQWYNRRYEKEIDAKRLWEENMKEAAHQYAKMESELQKIVKDNSRKRKALRTVRASISAGSPPPTTTTTGTNETLTGIPDVNVEFVLPESISSSTSQGIANFTHAGTTTTTTTLDSAESPAGTPKLSNRKSRTISLASPILSPAFVEEAIDKATEGDSDSSDDDFYDAISSSVIRVDQHLISSPGVSKEDIDALGFDILGYDAALYEGYEDLRHDFPLKADDRPPVSLWAIFKGSIGKDLTRISFPVYFNEPTSMLQRMAEDMEFSECLDAAANNPDSTVRIAYVGAFAMSNYSSTIGRIAKPFNPMLSETFEYVRLDKGYRYMSEQVSHHPPISACIGEALRWRYNGEVDAKSKFLGKSFEIRPTGTAHVTLFIPKEWAPDYPPAPGRPGFVSEHFTFNKVITNISGFVMGAPTIDHFGDMIIKNHRTSEKCILTFKPRSWRGRDACEIKGRVIDADENESWQIAGKWSTQLVARRSGVDGNVGDLAPDTSVEQKDNENDANGQRHEYLLLWKNSVKPPDMPFNMTPFAVTLNNLNPSLSLYLPPTDCRLRPDQHSFESGEFQRANDLKSELEDFQRNTRRQRERGELPPHRPRWFTRKRHPEINELYYWEPSRLPNGHLEYWNERERVGKARKGGDEAEFENVNHIFGTLEQRDITVSRN